MVLVTGSSMKHPIKDGKIEVVRMVNACFYWVRCSECTKPDQRLFEGKTPIKPSRILPGDRVFIRHFNGLYDRGVVQETGTSEIIGLSRCGVTELIFYDVFLVDRLERVKVPSSSIFKFENLPQGMDYEAPHIIGLYGAKLRHVDREYLNDVVGEHVNKLFNLSSSIEFLASSDVYDDPDCCVFGKVILKTKKGTQCDLLDHLVESDIVRRRADFIKVLRKNNCINCIKEETTLVNELINRPLPVHKEMNIPPAPRVVCNSQKLVEFRKLTYQNDPLIKPEEDCIIPIVFIESFNEFNGRLKLGSSRDACGDKTDEIESVVTTSTLSSAEAIITNGHEESTDSNLDEGQFDGAPDELAARQDGSGYRRTPHTTPHPTPDLIGDSCSTRRSVLEMKNEEARIVENDSTPAFRPCASPTSRNSNVNIPTLPIDERHMRLGRKTPINGLHESPQVPGTPLSKGRGQIFETHENKVPVFPRGRGRLLEMREPLQGRSPMGSVKSIGESSLVDSSIVELLPNHSINPFAGFLSGTSPKVATLLKAKCDNSTPTKVTPKEATSVQKADQNVAVSSALPDVRENSSARDDIWRSASNVELKQTLQYSSGFVHGSVDFKPVEFVSNLDFHEKISQILRTRCRDLTRPQRSTMPAILKRRNVVLVGPPGSKKSTAIVAPLIHLLTEEKHYTALSPGNGPRCVFVAPSSDRVRELKQHCTIFSDGVISPQSIIATFRGGSAKERMEDLTNGCDVLITTPRCWLDLLQHPLVTNWFRLCHLVLDQYDTLNELFGSELKEIFSKLKILEEFRKKKGEGFESLMVQIIINAERWSRSIETCCSKDLEAPVVIITSYAEALLYARIGLVVTLCDNETTSRRTKVRELINQYVHKKIAIFCNSPDEVEEIFNESGACTGHNFIHAHEKMETSRLVEVRDQWIQSKKPPVLVLTDNTLGDFYVTDAQVVIHFNLPASRRTFSERFAVLQSHIPDRILNPEINLSQCAVHVLFDDKVSDAPFPFLMNLLQRHPFPYSRRAEVLESIKAVEMKKELAKTSSICDRILSCGRCYMESTCPQRHVIKPEMDRSRGEEQNWRLIKIRILKIFSAVKFAARILAVNTDPEGAKPWTKVGGSFFALKVGISTYFNEPINRRQHWRAEPGDVLAYKDDMEDKYHRARVLEITKTNKEKEPTRVKIFLMDDGEELEAETYSLYKLPENYQTSPDQAIFVYVGNLRPIDADISWSETARRSVQNEIRKRDFEELSDEDIVGRILFATRHNYVVDNLTWRRTMRYASANVLNIRSHIITNQFGEHNPDYIDNIEKLFKRAYGDDYTGTYENPTVDLQDHQNSTAWAHLNTGENYVNVAVTAVISPAQFYVTSNKFQPRRIELEKDIKKALTKEKTALSSPKLSDICVIERDSIAANERLWHRCRVEQVEENDRAIVFFVDSGETVSARLDELFLIPSNLVTKLPFQAVECSLFGVSDILSNEYGSSGTEDIKLEFEALISRYSADGICVKVESLAAPKNTGGKCHRVILLGFDEGHVVKLNELLLKICIGNKSTPTFDINEEEVRKHHALSETTTIDENDVSDDEEIQKEPVELLRPLVEVNQNPPVGDLPEFNWDNLDEEELVDVAHALFKTPETHQLTESHAPEGPGVGTPSRIEDSKSFDNNTEPVDLQEFTERRPKPTESLTLKNDSQPRLVPAFEYKNPEVVWRQNLSQIGLRFKLPGLVDYRMQVTIARMYFSGFVEGTNGPNNYAKQIFFFGPVSLISENLDGMGLTVKLLKKAPGNWPRLTYAPNKDRMLNVDPDHLQDDQDERSMIERLMEKGIRGMQRRMPVKTGQETYNHVETDDEYESDDSTLHYTELKTESQVLFEID